MGTQKITQVDVWTSIISEDSYYVVLYLYIKMSVCLS